MPYRTQYEDTYPEIERIQIEGYRRMSSVRKLQIAAEMVETAKLLQAQDVRRRYPNASEREVKLRVASRWLDAERMRRAFGWDPEVEGY